MGKMRFWCVLCLGLFLGSFLTIGCGGSGGAPAIAQTVVNAIEVAFDNSTNGMTSTEMQSAIEELNLKIALLETANANLEAKTAAMSVSGNELYFTGVNVHVRNGQGATESTNSLGNLIVGYNETAGGTRTGSHNLVIGRYHSYTSYGGYVSGDQNYITGPYSSISGGTGNRASGNLSTVSGGAGNIASGEYSNVSGGIDNTASGSFGSISGGWTNTASGGCSSVLGGRSNTADEQYSSIGGGQSQNTSSPYQFLPE